MDDGHGCGYMIDVQWLLSELAHTVQLKEAIIHVNGTRYQHLKRDYEIGECGAEISSNPRYVEKMAEVLGLVGANTASTPMVEPSIEELDQAALLSSAKVKQYRSGVGLALYIAFVGPAIPNTVRCLSRRMANPTDLNHVQLRRLCRYLLGTKQYNNSILLEGSTLELHACSDSDHAGCKLSRRSTSCGVYMLGGAVVHNFSRTQKPVALSSVEKEWSVERS